MVLAFMFLLLYVWRRIYGLEAYSQILEKKLINLRKENKELHGMLNDTRECSLNEADALLKEIFQPQVKKCTQRTCTKEDQVHIKFIDNPETSTKQSTDITELSDISELSNLVIMPIEDETRVTDTAGVAGVTGIADIVDTDKNQDNESVISDVNGIYNKKKLGKLNLEKLKEICTGMNISTEGTKNTLIDRILSSNV